MFDCMFKHTKKSLNTNNLYTTHHPCTSKRLNLKKNLGTFKRNQYYDAVNGTFATGATWYKVWRVRL